MPALMSKPAYRQQQGAILLEGLIAILLFSMGILAIVGLQAAAIKTVADSQYRLQASFLANRLVAQMWANTADISSYVVPGGADADARYRIERAQGRNHGQRHERLSSEDQRELAGAG